MIHRVSALAYEVIDRPAPALGMTLASVTGAEAVRTTHWVDSLAAALAPYAALCGYCVTFAIALWWARKWIRYVVGVVLSARDMTAKCAKCRKLSLRCAGCLREILKSDED